MANLQNTTINNTVTVGSGSAGAPSINFSGDTDTGIWSPNSDTIAISTGGDQQVTIDSSGNLTAQGTVTAGDYSGISSSNVTTALGFNPFNSAGGTFSSGLAIHRNTGLSYTAFASGNNPTHEWNDENKVNLVLRNNNNAMSFIVGGTSNQRHGIIQVGHSTGGGDAGDYGGLWLNRLGGTVIANSTTISDERFKTDITPIDDALEKTTVLSGYTYYRTDVEQDRRQAGLLAQEVLGVLPEAVVHNETDDMSVYSITYGMLSALYVEAIKELAGKTKQLNDIINNLEG